jgi:hypothetical protein
MAVQPAHLPGNIGGFTSCLGACLLVSFSALAQTSPPQGPAASPADQQETVVGCLGSPQGEFQLSDEEGNVYQLTGRTSGLEKYRGEEISVQGTRHEDTKPLPSFNVASLKEIFRAPSPKLSPAFSDPSKWDLHTNSEFGIKFALPPFHASTAVSTSDDQANFASGQGSVSLAGLDLPREIYAVRTSREVRSQFLQTRE